MLPVLYLFQPIQYSYFQEISDIAQYVFRWRHLQSKNIIYYIEYLSYCIFTFYMNWTQSKFIPILFCLWLPVQFSCFQYISYIAQHTFRWRHLQSKILFLTFYISHYCIFTFYLNWKLSKFIHMAPFLYQTKAVYFPYFHKISYIAQFVFRWRHLPG